MNMLGGGWYVAVAPEGKRLDLTSAKGGDVCDGTPLMFTAFDRAGNGTEAMVVVRSPTACPDAATDEGGCSLVARPLPPGRARAAIAGLLLGGLLLRRRRATSRSELFVLLLAAGLTGCSANQSDLSRTGSPSTRSATSAPSAQPSAEPPPAGPSAAASAAPSVEAIFQAHRSTLSQARRAQ